MPAINFQKQFAAAVESGQKRQTIRARRMDGRNPKPCDTLYLYTGMRTKGCRKLAEVECISVDLFQLEGEMDDYGIWRETEARIGNYPLDVEEIAVADGFESARHMLEWFEKTHGLPFEGLLIRW